MVAIGLPRCARDVRKNLDSVCLPLSLIRGSQVLASFIDGALSVVSGLDRLAIFVHRSRPLSCHVKNLTQTDMAPDLGPPRFLISVEGFAILVGRRLIVSLQPEDPGDAVMRQRAVLVDFKRLVEFGEGLGQVAFLNSLLA